MKRDKKEKKKYSVWRNYRYIYGELWHFDKKVMLCGLFEILFLVAQAFGAVLMPSLIVGMLEQHMPVGHMMANTILAFGAYGLICAGASFFQQRNGLQYIEFRVGHMMGMAQKKVMELDYCQYEDEETQKLLQKGMESFQGNQWGLEGILHDDIEMVTAFLGLLLYAFVISGASPWIAVLLLVISVFQIVSFQFANRYELKHKEPKAELDITKKYLDREAYEVAPGKDVRLYQLKEWLIGHYREANRKYQSMIAKERGCYFANDLFGLVLQFVRDIICYGYLIVLLRNGMPASQFVLYIGIVSGFSTYFSQITTKITEIGRFQKMVSFTREFLDLPQLFHHGEGVVLERKEPTIEVEFSHVSFSYPKHEENGKIVPGKKILDDVSFTMKKGEKMALVGINGAGKSTIVKLICGFYKPDAGHIYINGVDLSEMDLDEYYKDLAVVFQDSFTYSYTIADNVSCCVEEKYDREKCMDALKRAGLWEKIKQLPKKENTCLNKDVEEDGIQLSGGQLQKLMLARALYKDCRLLLLDEPTAALDAIAENEMYEKYKELIAGRTALFISHRLASTRFCDKILFLENGKIVEEGTHEELMEKNGGYAHMFEVQSQYYREGGEQNESEECMA